MYTIVMKVLRMTSIVLISAVLWAAGAMVPVWASFHPEKEAGPPVSQDRGLHPIVLEDAPNPEISEALEYHNKRTLVEMGAQIGSAGKMVIRKNGAGEQIKTDSKRILNNVWGAPEDEKLTSNIYLNPNGSLGWEWERNNPKLKPGSGVLPIYPSVRIGGSPWDKSQSQYFPIKWEDVRNLTLNAQYDYLEKPTGTYDLAYDIFFTDTDQFSSSPKIKAEVMIWINATMKQPENTYQGDFSDGANTYRLFHWTMKDGRQYYSFLMKGDPLSLGQHSVNAKNLIDHIYGLDPSWFIHGVDFGNEIMNGCGKIQINQVSVNLNGNQV